jgi:hypothetical protein
VKKKKKCVALVNWKENLFFFAELIKKQLMYYILVMEKNEG